MGEHDSEWALQGENSKSWANHYDDGWPGLQAPPYQNELSHEGFENIEFQSYELEALENLGHEYFLKTYPVWSSKYYTTPPKDFEEAHQRVTEMGEKRNETKPLSKEEKIWCNTYFQLLGHSAFHKNKNSYRKKGEKLHPVRKRIVDQALSMVGTVVAERPSGETRKVGGQNIETNIGADLLVDFFEQIAPHKLTLQSKSQYEKDRKDNNELSAGRKNLKEAKKAAIMNHKITTKGSQLRDSWCGIFAFWLQDKAGNGKTMWEPNLSVSDDKHKFMNSNEELKPGDMCYSPEHNQHWGTIIAVEGDNIISVDGNSKPASGIWLQSRPKSYWKYFVRARPKNEKVSTNF